MLMNIAKVLVNICNNLELELIFKASYKKANRTNIDSFTGIGDLKALGYIKDVSEKYNIKVSTDVHSPEEAEMASEYVDVLQIPAFLCRQTDLLVAAGKTGKTVNIKKGQFMAPEDMKNAVQKVESTGNNNIMLTERGYSFGYHNLVVDFRSLLIMKDFGYPVVYDATHSLQQPSIGKQSGGFPRFIPALSRAAVAVGVDGIFFETHPEPAKAKSDSATQLPLVLAETFLQDIKTLSKVDFLLNY
jgi:2-dehydro-3-deoxyphosphooctonate aldolase (KDO 8-P synthase)